MREFFEWFKANRIDTAEPWLILGKGPSFTKRANYDLNAYHKLSLNHAVREQKVRVAHIIDHDVIDRCGDAILTNADVLAMPWRPHVNFVPGEFNLEQLARANPTLRKMNERGRLVWYNLSSAHEQHNDSPVVSAEFFSAEAGLNLLALAGVRQVRSLGIDGGREYSHEFDDLKEKTLLACGHQSFDRQFSGFAKTINATGVDYAPLDADSPIRIYVGASEAEALPFKVLEHSIRQHASMTTQIMPLYLSPIIIPRPAHENNRPRTPFSFQRFLIPAMNQYQGRAIYLDSDMLVFDDVRKIWNLSVDDVPVLMAGGAGFNSARLSVLLLNCAALNWDIEQIVGSLDAGALSYEQLMLEGPAGTKLDGIGPEWNSLDHYQRGQTALLHFTDMNTQPWLARSNRWNRLWMEALFAAMDAGEISMAEIEAAATRGHVRPSLVYQAKLRIAESRKLDKKIRQLDEGFVPPHAGHRQPAAGHGFRRWVKSVLNF